MKKALYTPFNFVINYCIDIRFSDSPKSRGRTAVPIIFKYHNAPQKYLEVSFSGCVDDSQHLQAWKDFHNSSKYIKGYDAVVDLSEADITKITSEGLRTVLEYKNAHYKKNNITGTRVAVFAPRPLLFGLSRMYDSLDYESNEEVMVFGDKEQAMSWLLDENK